MDEVAEEDEGDILEIRKIPSDLRFQRDIIHDSSCRFFDDLF